MTLGVPETGAEGPVASPRAMGGPVTDRALVLGSGGLSGIASEVEGLRRSVRSPQRSCLGRSLGASARPFFATRMQVCPKGP